MAADQALRCLLSPASIAIVGASDQIGPGFNAWPSGTAGACTS